MCSVLVPCFDAIVIYSCLSYTSVVLYLSASASLTLTSVILHIWCQKWDVSGFTTYHPQNKFSGNNYDGKHSFSRSIVFLLSLDVDVNVNP